MITEIDWLVEHANRQDLSAAAPTLLHEFWNNPSLSYSQLQSMEPSWCEVTNILISSRHLMKQCHIRASGDHENTMWYER